MGKRLLREWIGRPLVNLEMLEQRLDAVTELRDSTSVTIERLKKILHGSMPDLSRGMSRIQYGRVSLFLRGWVGRCGFDKTHDRTPFQATPSEAALVLLTFHRLANDLPAVRPNNALLAHIKDSFDAIKGPVDCFRQMVDIQKARKDVPEDMFKDPTQYPDIGKARAVSGQVFSKWPCISDC